MGRKKEIVALVDGSKYPKEIENILGSNLIFELGNKNTNQDLKSALREKFRGTDCSARTSVTYKLISIAGSDCVLHPLQRAASSEIFETVPLGGVKIDNLLRFYKSQILQLNRDICFQNGAIDPLFSIAYNMAQFFDKKVPDTIGAQEQELSDAWRTLSYSHFTTSERHRVEEKLRPLSSLVPVFEMYPDKYDNHPLTKIK